MDNFLINLCLFWSPFSQHADTPVCHTPWLELSLTLTVCCTSHKSCHNCVSLQL